MRYAFPSLIGLDMKSVKMALPDIGAGSTVEVEVVYPDNFLIIGIPEIKTDNTKLKTKIINGEIGNGNIVNKLVIEITNTDGSNTVSGANMTVKCIGINGA